MKASLFAGYQDGGCCFFCCGTHGHVMVRWVEREELAAALLKFSSECRVAKEIAVIDECQYTDEERRALIRQHMWQAAPQRLNILRTQFNQPTGRSIPSRLLPRARPDSSFAVSSHDAMRV